MSHLASGGIRKILVVLALVGCQSGPDRADAGLDAAGYQDAGETIDSAIEAGSSDGGLQDAMLDSAIDAARDAEADSATPDASDGGPPGPGVRALSGGANYTCAVLDDGSVWCWGYNWSRQLGRDTLDVLATTPGPVDGLTGAEDVSCGWGHTCALMASRTVRCWGNSLSGQLGVLYVGSDVIPRDVPGVTGAIGIAVGGDVPPGGDEGGVGHSCALTVDGRVLCWGDNRYGQLGDGTTTNRMDAAVVSLPSDAVDISAGAFHTCAALDTGEVHCWGSNTYWSLGFDTEASYTTPQRVPGVTDAIDVEAQHYQTCAQLRNGEVTCWGIDGQHPRAIARDPDARALPHVIAGTSEGTVRALPGGGHLCVWSSLPRAELRCAGDGSYGQLGDGSTTFRAALGPVPDAVGITVAASGPSHVCVYAPTTGTRCWGANYFGGVGDGTRVDRFTPVGVAW